MELKHWIYFGFGTLATIPFGLRSLSQWLFSEFRKKSHVTTSFWVLSIMGNVLMLMHYFIQMQYHLYFIRFFPLYFGFRQYALIQKKAQPFSLKRLIYSLVTIFIVLTTLFVFRVYLTEHNFRWIIGPQMPWAQSEKQFSSFCHIMGFIGALLFMSRLWVQWWQSEKAQESVLTKTFWLMSLVGGSLTLIYALYIQDLITALGYSVGLIPYIRNLMLLNKETKEAI